MKGQHESPGAPPVRRTCEQRNEGWPPIDPQPQSSSFDEQLDRKLDDLARSTLALWYKVIAGLDATDPLIQVGATKVAELQRLLDDK